MSLLSTDRLFCASKSYSGASLGDLASPSVAEPSGFNLAEETFDLPSDFSSSEALDLASLAALASVCYLKSCMPR